MAYPHSWHRLCRVREKPNPSGRSVASVANTLKFFPSEQRSNGMEALSGVGGHREKGTNLFPFPYFGKL
jgi:hypothetical protein